MAKDNSLALLLEEIQKGKNDIDKSKLFSKHLNEKLRTLNEDEDEDIDSDDEEDNADLSGLEDVSDEGGTDDQSSIDDMNDSPENDDASTDTSSFDDASQDGEFSTDVDSSTPDSLNPLSAYTPDEDGNYHVTLSSDEIPDFLSKLPSDAQVVMVKKPSYDISVTTTDEDGDGDMEDLTDDVDAGLDMGEESGEADVPMKENKELKILMKRNALYESKIKDLQKQLKLQESQIEMGKKQVFKLKEALTEGKNVILTLRTINENLQNTMYLFGQYGLTSTEKQMVIEGFSQASTIESSKLLLEVYKKQFDNVLTKKAPSKEEITGKQIVIENKGDNKSPNVAPKHKSQFFKFID